MWIPHKYLTVLLVVSLGVTGISFAQELVEITGQVRPPGNTKLPPEGVAVVLLKYVLDGEGQLQTTGPVARTQSQASGHFNFDPMRLETKAAYQLGSQYEGNLLQSEFFFLQPDQTQATVNILIPGLSENVAALEAANVALFIEPGLGLLVVTELVNVLNPTQDIIDSRKAPLIFDLPEAYTDFSSLHQSSNGQQDYELLGEQLQYHRLFPPGETTLIFRYTLPVLFGSYELHKRYRYSIKSGRVLVPLGQLELTSPQLTFSKMEHVGENQFNAWEFGVLEQPELIIQISAIPIRQIVYGYIGIGLFLILLLLVFVFIRLRL